MSIPLKFGNIYYRDTEGFFLVFVFLFVFFKTGFSVALEPVLELALADQAVLKLRDPSASAS